jgi:NAD(P)H dehydrogenase (quinone)
MKIGVTGATGHLGHIVIEKLKERISTESIVALVRSPQKALDLGVEVREFDYAQPDKLVNSLKDIDNLLLISSNEMGQRAKQHENVIEAAKKARVQWIVYTSLLRADTSTLSLAAEHLTTEIALKKSGIQYTILRNGWYTENYTGSIQGAIAGGAFLGSAGNGKISSAARADFAEAAVVVLTGNNHKEKIYELAGDEAYTLTDLAAEISKQTGKNIPYKNLPEAEYASVLKSFGLPEGFAFVVAGWDTSVSKGDLLDSNHQLSKLIGRKTTSLAQTVKNALETIG